MRDKDKLTPALEYELQFLRKQVDFWQQQYLQPTASPSARDRYDYAKADLTKFVSNSVKMIHHMTRKRRVWSIYLLRKAV